MAAVAITLPAAVDLARRIAQQLLRRALLRWVVRPTRGVPEYGHHRMGVGDYVMLGVRLGGGGLVRLAARFAAAVWEMFRLRSASLSEAARALKEEQERRMAALAEATRVGIERLRALAALQAPPVTLSVSKILAGVLLDRLALGVVAAGTMAAIAVTGALHAWRWPAAGGIAIAWTLAHFYFRGATARSGSERGSTTTKPSSNGPATWRASSRRRSSSWVTRTRPRWWPSRRARRLTSTSGRGTRPRARRTTSRRPIGLRARTW